MICPNCESSFTRIEPNTNHYTCYNCHHTFGYVAGSKSHCPRCNSTDVTEIGGYLQCNNDDCRFVICLGYETLEDGDYVQHSSCGARFQTTPGQPVQCSNCHPVGSIDPPSPVSCAFISETDESVRFPQNVIFPERTLPEFYRNRDFNL